jgi:hypothetical protein
LRIVAGRGRTAGEELPGVGRTLVAVALIAGLAGCSVGGTHPHDAGDASTATATVSTGPSPAASPECPAALRATFSRAARTAAVVVHSDASANYVACAYSARATAGGCTGATVTINDQAQAYWDFQRWVVASAQTAGQSHQPDMAPVQLHVRIGLEADWIPGNLNLEAASSNRWVAVFLTCPVRRSRNLVLAENLARLAMAA